MAKRMFRCFFLYGSQTKRLCKDDPRCHAVRFRQMFQGGGNDGVLLASIAYQLRPEPITRLT
eukprot:2770831-Amphidinium_carterae.1